MDGIRIVSPGPLSADTKVFGPDGSEIGRGSITRIVINPIEPNNINTATVELGFIDLEWQGSVDFRMLNPKTGQHEVVKRIEFADGSAVDL